VTAVPFTDRQRAALARHHGYTRAGAVWLRKVSPTMDDADSHDITLAALIRACRRHDDPPLKFYFHCLRLELIDWYRSARNEGGTTRSGRTTPARVSLSYWCHVDDGRSQWSDMIAVTDPATIDARDEIDTALARLPDRLRRVLVDRHYHGYEWSEVAGRHGVSEATIYNDHREAIARLRGEPIPSRNSRSRHRRDAGA